MQTRFWKFIALAASMSLVAAACGDDDDSGSSGSNSSSSTTAAAGSDTTAAAGADTTAAAGGDTTEAPAPAGEPILIGMINQEDTPAGSFPEIRVATEAAVEYVNNELGGIDGRPIELVTCTTQGTPESAQTCANEMVENGVLLVTSGIDFGTGASLPILADAGLLYVGGVPLLPAEYIADNTYFFIGGSASAFPGLSVYLGDVGAKSVNILYTDNPAGLQAATAFGKDILEEDFGIQGIKLIPEKADAVDFTAAVSAAVEGDPDAVMVLFAGSGCGNIMKARASLGVSEDILFLYPGSCSADVILESGGAGAEDALFNAELILFNDESDPQVALYRDKLEQYGEGEIKFSTFSQVGFQTIMNFVEIFSAIGVDNLSTETIREYLDSTVDHPSFMAHPFTCDGAQVPGLRAVCGSSVRIVQNQGGALVDVLDEWINGGQLIGPKAGG